MLALTFTFILIQKIPAHEKLTRWRKSLRTDAQNVTMNTSRGQVVLFLKEQRNWKWQLRNERKWNTPNPIYYKQSIHFWKRRVVFEVVCTINRIIGFQLNYISIKNNLISTFIEINVAFRSDCILILFYDLFCTYCNEYVYVYMRLYRNCYKTYILLLVQTPFPFLCKSATIAKLIRRSWHGRRHLTTDTKCLK